MSRSFEKSKALLKRAEGLMPGGVNSPVRAFNAVGGNPPFIESAQGAWLTDADGNRYVDYVGTWGPAILGHAHPEVIAAITAAASRGTSFGAPTAAEVEMAEIVRDFVPSVEMMRMVSSGTEACMSALRLARGFTGRDGIVKFEGCYHGHADSLLVKAGSGLATFGEPSSAGVPADLAKHTYTLPFNDPAALEALFEAHGDQLSCVILELVCGNMGVIPPSDAFVEALRTIPAKYGALLIVDEVMTGFRVDLGGAQARYGLDPDITCLGKVVGGGLPAGIYGGKASIMAKISPLGPVYQAGTLSGNPLATAAGLTTLQLLKTPGLFAGVCATTQELCEGLQRVLDKKGIAGQIQRVGTMFTLFFSEQPIVDFETAKASDHARFGRYHRSMLEQGIYLPPSGYEACFVSAAHGEAEVERTLKAAEVALDA